MKVSVVGLWRMRWHLQVISFRRNRGSVMGKKWTYLMNVYKGGVPDQDVWMGEMGNSSPVSVKDHLGNGGVGGR